MEPIGTDLIGHPIYVGSRLAWGVKGHLRLGSAVELHHTTTGKSRKRGQVEDNYIRTTTLTEDKPLGRGGVFLDKHLLVVKA